MGKAAASGKKKGPVAGAPGGGKFVLVNPVGKLVDSFRHPEAESKLKELIPSVLGDVFPRDEETPKEDPRLRKMKKAGGNSRLRTDISVGLRQCLRRLRRDELALLAVDAASSPVTDALLSSTAEFNTATVAVSGLAEVLRAAFGFASSALGIARRPKNEKELAEFAVVANAVGEQPRPLVARVPVIGEQQEKAQDNVVKMVDEAERSVAVKKLYLRRMDKSERIFRPGVLPVKKKPDDFGMDFISFAKE